MRDFYEVIMYIREFNSGITICIEILRETNKFHELQHQAKPRLVFRSLLVFTSPDIQLNAFQEGHIL